MLTRTEGIVLKTQKYGEADLIVTYLTLGKGIINAFARSPRKIRSRFGSSLEPLTHTKISLMGKEQSIPKITQSDIINSFQQLREDYHDFISISRLAEILLSLTPAGIPNKRLFTFFLNTLNLATSAAQGSRHTLYLIAQIRLLAMIGYAPRLNKCGRCSNKSLNFYPDSGTTICSRCAASPPYAKDPPVRITPKIINFYTHCIEWPVNILVRLKPHPEILSGLSVLLDKHLNYLLSKKILTSEFLKASAPYNKNLSVAKK